MKSNFFRTILLITAVCFGVVSCNEQRAEIGQHAPDLAAFDLQGNPVALAQFQDKPTLMTFWSESCGVCIMELKTFQQMAEKFPNKINILAINIDGEKANTQAVIAKHKIALAVAKDQLKITGERYQVIGSPTSFLIDQNGKIRYKFEGLISPEQLQHIFTES
ncbi:thioredoxin [Pasteurellaceae bacterium Pebbles2]|nr:thioredoxin [Pasteurellaceae bacterium Pebbles2]